MNRWIALSLLLIFGCTSGAAEEDCWWCTDDDSTTDDVDTDDGKDTDGKDTDGKDTDGKDTDGKDTDGASLWRGALDPNSGLGVFGYESKTCIFDYRVSTAAAAGGCDACEFAWEITLGAVEMELDDGCGELTSYGGAVISYGHEDPSVLWSQKGGDWAVSENGSGKVYDGVWHFQFSASGGGK